MANTENQVRIRFAPSPTGFVHIGSLRTVLYDYLIAKKYGGKFILRIEDTDQKRQVDGAVEEILQTLKWAAIEPDEGVCLNEQDKVIQQGQLGPYIQSQRLEIYKKYADELIDKGLAYPCFCSADRLGKIREQQQKNKLAPKYDQCCRKLSTEQARKKIQSGEKYVIRMKVPENEIIEFNDLVFGKISVNSSTIDDQVLVKSDGFPTYHLAVVIDDHLMEISHITRGEEWLPSTPKHVLLYKYFSWDLPVFIHFPNVLGQDHKKLSKRQGDVSVSDFIKKGYLPEAIVNFLALLGWNPKTEQEFFSLDELIAGFDENAIHKAGAVFDYKKLDWMNSHYIKRKSQQELIELCRPYINDYCSQNQNNCSEEKLDKIIQVEKERIKKISEISENIQFYFQLPDYDKSLLSWKGVVQSKILGSLEISKKIIEAIDEGGFSLDNIQDDLLKAAGQDRGSLLWPLRVALSGRERSPSPFEIAWIIGKQETLKRIEFALDKIKN